jgi:hypothetical protein
MRNSVDINSRHSRAIVKKIGDRLRESLEEERELPASFQKQIERFRQLEERSQANVARDAAKPPPAASDMEERREDHRKYAVVREECRSA